MGLNRLPVAYDPKFAALQQSSEIPTPVVFYFDNIWDRVIDPITGRAMHFDKQGTPISMLQWSELRERGLDSDGKYGPNSYQRVAEDTVGEAWISTVWLGMDHGFGFGDPENYRPVIFETMIFGGKYNECQMRYCTEAEAVKGHGEAVADLRAGMEPWWAYGGQENDEWHHSGSEAI